MKWNWGYGIALFYTIFVLALGYQLYRSFQYDRSLVVDDYYAKDLAYQEQYDRLNNAQTHNADLKLSRQNGMLTIQFPQGHEAPQGGIQFYRPDNKDLDQHYPIKVDSAGQFHKDIQDLIPGKWRIKVSWQWQGVDYFVEKETVIP